MSTDYFPKTPIPFEKLKGIHGELHEVISLDTTEDSAGLTIDDKNFLWANKTSDGNTTFTRYGGNNPEAILQYLETTFSTKIISEYEVDA